jgi:signal transduction histidine kinase/CheY-like chemotaxis protein
MSGRLAEFGDALDEAAPSLRASELVELRAAMEFNSGKLREPPAPSRLAVVAWQLWTDLPFGAVVVATLLRVAAIVVSLTGRSEQVYERMRVRLAPDLVHFRYTDFVQGLVYAAILHAFAPRQALSLRAYYGALRGMFECLSGRFDLGLASLQRGHAALCVEHERVNATGLVDADVYERFLSISVLLALYLSYAGKHDEADREYERCLERTRVTGRYALIEIFLYSVRMYTDLEQLNADSLGAGAVALKRLLGEHFRGKFGLRAAIYASLAATMLGKHDLARQQLALSEQLYKENLSAVELARYHFLRGLVHLQSSELPAAKIHARRAGAFVSQLRGGRFHEADALLLDVELRLRARLRAGELAPDATESTHVVRALTRASKLVVGSEFMDVRVRALRLYHRFLCGRFRGLESELEAVSLLARRASKRMGLVLGEIDTRGGQLQALVTAEADADRRRDLSLLDRFGRLVRAEQIGEEAVSLLTFLVAADGCDVQTEHGVRGVPSGIEMLPSGDRLELVIVGGGQRTRFTLHRPLVELCFDERATELMRLAAEVIRVAMERRELLHLQKQVVLARTMQMLVHDVRRPFGALQAVMKAIADAATPQEIRATVDGLLPEVQRAYGLVSTLIDDVVDLGNDRAPRREAVLPELLLDECIRETVTAPAARGVELHYDLRHTRAWCAEPVRVRRLIVNLLSNAVQALGGSGNIWIASKDEGDRIEMVIGNDGPPIAPEDMPHIFEAFFTKGKSRGTGLGLAVAMHVASTHGGSIQCRGGKPAGVEFVFTLPASSTPIDAPSAAELRTRLPARSTSGEWSLAGLRGTTAPATSVEEVPPSSRLLLKRLAYLGRRIEVLLVDDDRTRLAAIQSWLAEWAPAGTVRVSCQWGPAAAMAVLRERTVDLALVSLRGRGEGDRCVELVRALRAARDRPYLCVDAVGAPADEISRARVEGPDVIKTTPIERADAHAWLLAVAERVILPRARRSDPGAHVAVIDDSRVHLADWRNALQADAKVRAFASPSAFWAEADADRNLVSSLDIVIVDYVFLDCDVDGVAFARALKKLRPQLPVCLSTSGYGIDAELAGAIDVVVDKAAISYEALRRRIEAARQGDRASRDASDLLERADASSCDPSP